jgi:hypothetical protein
MASKKKASKDSREDRLERISAKAAEAAQEVKDRLHSVTIAIEQRVAIEGHIHNVTREMDYLLDGIDEISRKNQRKVLLAYKKFLEENLNAVNGRLKMG